MTHAKPLACVYSADRLACLHAQRTFGGFMKDPAGPLFRVPTHVVEQGHAHDAIGDSEEWLRLTFDSVTDYAIFTLDIAGRINTWNSGAEQIFGYTHAEVAGKSTDVIFTPEDRRAGVPQHEIRLAREQGRASDERWHVRKDGTRFYASGVMTPLRRGGEITGFAKIARDMTVQRETGELLREAHQLLEQRVAERTAELAHANESLHQKILERQLAETSRRKLLRQLVNAQEQERRRISRELHDQLGQQVSVLVLKLALLKQQSHIDDDMRRELEQLSNLAKELDAAVDFLVWELRPTALDDLGLVSALSDYVTTWSSHFGVEGAFEASAAADLRLPRDIETVLYRVVQEALTNVGKHAHARRAAVSLLRDGDALVLTVRDDGVGFDAAQPVERRGVGLLSMSERAALVGGAARIDSTPGQGTTVLVRVPMSLPSAREHRPATEQE